MSWLGRDFCQGKANISQGLKFIISILVSASFMILNDYPALDYPPAYGYECSIAHPPTIFSIHRNNEPTIYPVVLLPS